MLAFCILFKKTKETMKTNCLQCEMSIVLITTINLETLITGHHMNKDLWT